MWPRIEGLNISRFYSDRRKSYNEFVPVKKHIQTKAETFTVEGYNCIIRHYPARFFSFRHLVDEK